MSLKIFLTYFSTHQTLANQIASYISDKYVKIDFISESVPNNLATRARLVNECDIFIVLISRNFQKSWQTMSLLYFAKNKKKRIVILNNNISYKPFGALGMIVANHSDGVLLIHSESMFKANLDFVNKLVSELKPTESRRNSSAQSKSVGNSSFNLKETQSPSYNEIKSSSHSSNKSASVYPKAKSALDMKLMTNSEESIRVVSSIYGLSSASNSIASQNELRALVEDSREGFKAEPVNNMSNIDFNIESDFDWNQSSSQLDFKNLPVKEPKSQSKLSVRSKSSAISKKDPMPNFIEESFLDEFENDSQVEELNINESNVELNYVDGKNINLLVLFHYEQIDTINVLEKILTNTSLEYLCEDATNLKSNVKNAQVILLVMSDAFEANARCRTTIQKALELNKIIIPLIPAQKYRPKNWLNFIFYGRVCHRIYSLEQGLKKVHNSIPIFDMVSSIVSKLELSDEDNEREQIILQSIHKHIDECRNQLRHWPPKHRTREAQVYKKPEIKMSIPIPPEKIEPPYDFDFVDPKPLFDQHGAPYNDKFECVISYHDEKIELVKEIYTKFRVMYGLDVWFDISSGSQGNSLDISANAIECSPIFVVLLTNKYQKSMHCKTEFAYALMRDKFIILLIADQDLVIEPWLEPMFLNLTQFELVSGPLNQADKYGMTKLDHIVHMISDAVKSIGEGEYFEWCDEIVKLRELLDDALDDLDEINKKLGIFKSSKDNKDFKRCTRCGKKYSIIRPKKECATHKGYFVEKKEKQYNEWVCCHGREPDSPGCIKTYHIDVERKWIRDLRYDTFRWKPS